MLFTKKAHRLFSCKWKLDTFTDSEEQKLVLALFYGVGIFGILLSRSSNTSLADRKTVHVFCCVTVFRRMDGRFGPVAECERNSATDAGAGRDDPPPMAVPGIARRSDAGGAMQCGWRFACVGFRRFRCATRRNRAALREKAEAAEAVLPRMTAAAPNPEPGCGYVKIRNCAFSNYDRTKRYPKSTVESLRSALVSL